MTIRIILIFCLIATPVLADVMPDFGGDYVGMITTQRNERDYEQRKSDDEKLWRDLYESNRRAEDELARQKMEMQMEDMRLDIQRMKENR